MRPITATVGPLASAAANNIATSQTPAAGATTAATFTASSASIAATNSFVAGEQVQLLNRGGVLPVGFTAQNNYFVSATGLTGSAFELAPVLGGTPIVAGSAGTGSQYVVSTTSVALNGSLVSLTGVAVLDNPRRILITTADTTHVFTVTGTSPTGTLLTETVGPITTSAYTTQDFATVTSITINGAPTAAVTVGTNAIAATPWVRTDEWADPSMSIQCDVSGTVNYTVQASNDDPNDPTNPVLPQNMTWIASNDANVVGATASQLSNYLFSPRYVRVLLNSGSGSVTATVTQYNVSNR